MALPIKNFYGEIDGLRASDYVKQLDYSLKTTKERLRKVEKILNNPLFFEIYFSEYHKVNINKEDFLSSDRNICKSIEKFADYLLLSSDINENLKDETKEWKTNYVFYTDRKLDSKIEKDNKRKVDTLMFLIDKNRNYRKQVKQKINKKDYYDKDFESEVKIYNINSPENFRIEKVNNLEKYKELPNLLKKVIDEINDGSYVLKEGEEPLWKIKKFLKENINSNKKELLLFKDKIKGTIYYNSCLPESEETNWFLANFTDQEQILSLLKMSPRNLLSDLGILIYDLKQLLEQINLSDFEKEVIKLWRENDYIQEDIANILGVSQQFIFATLKNICKKIILQYKDNYEDWLYLNYLKGTYKTCSICGEPKLISKFYKKEDNKDGFHNVCIKCMKS